MKRLIGLPAERLFPDLRPARVQFIEKIFPDLLAAANAGTAAHDWVRWVHDRLFIEVWSIEAVRAELVRALQSVRVLAVTSGKGGVGKTTVAVNLAVSFAQRGQRVLLFDADLGMANAHVFAGVNPHGTLLDVLEGRASLTSILTRGPAGIHVACGVSGSGRLAGLEERALEALGRELLQVAADFDVLLIDTGAGAAPMVTHFLALAQDVIVVATPNLAATLDAYGVLKVMHEKRLAARIHLLVNEAENEAEATQVFSRIGSCARQFLGTSPAELGFLERDPAFEAASRQRRPVVLAAPANRNAGRFTEIATHFSAHPPPHTQTEDATAHAVA